MRMQEIEPSVQKRWPEDSFESFDPLSIGAIRRATNMSPTSYSKKHVKTLYKKTVSGTRVP